MRYTSPKQGQLVDRNKLRKKVVEKGM